MRALMLAGAAVAALAQPAAADSPRMPVTRAEWILACSEAYRQVQEIGMPEAERRAREAGYSTINIVLARRMCRSLRTAQSAPDGIR